MSSVFNTQFNTNGSRTVEPIENSTLSSDVNGSIFTSEGVHRAGKNLILWTFPIVIIIGTIGNIFSFIVMLQRKLRQTSTFFYLAILALVDTMVLYVSALKTWIRVVADFELLHISDASCKILMFLVYFSLHFSAWLIVAVTIERFIAVWFPLKATSICNPRRAKISSLVIALVLCIINGHLFWTAKLHSGGDTGTKQCAMFAYHSIFYKLIWPWIHFIMYSFLPFVLLSVFNILIIVSLIRHRWIITSTMTKDDRRIRYNHRKLAITLLCISFAWILTTTPSALYTVLPLKPITINDQAKDFLIKVICYILLYLNHSVNFFLYCITGQNFRQEFVRFICRIHRRRRPPPPKLTFRASRSNSGQETSYPLMEHDKTSGNYPNRTSKSSSKSTSHSV